MNRRVTAERSACQLAASVGNHLVHVHVELGAAASHPDMQGEHIVVLASQDLVTNLDDQPETLIVEPLTVMIGNGSRLLQSRISVDHLAWDQIMTDTEMFERPLSLSTPELISGHLDHAEAISLFSRACHLVSPAESGTRPFANGDASARPDPEVDRCSLSPKMLPHHEGQY